jgi:hypothetical protein
MIALPLCDEIHKIFKFTNVSLYLSAVADFLLFQKFIPRWYQIHRHVKHSEYLVLKILSSQSSGTSTYSAMFLVLPLRTMSRRVSEGDLNKNQNILEHLKKRAWLLNFRKTNRLYVHPQVKNPSGL